MSRVYVIGYNKCGTSSLHEFFLRCGLRSVHYRYLPHQDSAEHDYGLAAFLVARNLDRGRPALHGYDDVDVISDFDAVCEHRLVENIKQFRFIAALEPDARFVLNVRDVDRWVRSRTRWGQGHLFGGRPTPLCEESLCVENLGYVERYRRYYGFTMLEQVEQHLRCVWHAHVNAVKSDIDPERLLVFDIERDDPALLCRFLGLPEEMAQGYGHRNVSFGPLFTGAMRLTPGFVKRRLPRRLKREILAIMRWLQLSFHRVGASRL